VKDFNVAEYLNFRHLSYCGHFKFIIGGVIMTEEKQVVRKKIAAAADVGKFMADYYLELDQASKKGEPKIAWCTSVGPAEILRAMDFMYISPKPIPPCSAPRVWPRISYPRPMHWGIRRIFAHT
jgi:hypothetical protein